MPFPGATPVDATQLPNTIPEVAKCIYKLYTLWGQVKEVPGEIQDIINEIKALEPIFRVLEARLQASSNISHLQHSLECSRRACESLNDLVAELGQEIAVKNGISKKVAMYKAVKKKETIRKLREKLMNCLNFLQLSLATYYR
jgi:predicted RNase H-like nuclease (RuvC/YqgF family)